jgi:PAS domain S-box-containing protein
VRPRELIRRWLDRTVRKGAVALERANQQLRDEIAERKKIEAELRRKEAFLTEVQRLSRTRSWISKIPSPDPRPRAGETFEFMGLDHAHPSPPSAWIWDVVHPEDRERVEKVVTEAIAAKQGYELEHRIVLPDGRVRIVHARGQPVADASGTVTEYIGTSTDVTKQRAVEAELRKQAELLSVAHEAVFVREPDGRVSFWNRGAEETYGWTAQEALGKPLHALLQTIFPVPLEEIEATTREQGRWEGELVQVRRDGTRIVVASRWSRQRGESGAPAATLHTNTDITARKRADEALARSEQRYRNIFESVGVAIVEHDFTGVMAVLDEIRAREADVPRYLDEHPEIASQTLGLIRITDVNHAAAKLLGAGSPEEFVKAAAVPVQPTPEIEAAWPLLLRAIAEGRRVIETELVLTTPQDERVSTLVTIVLPAPTSGYESVLVTVVDLTERHRAQEALQQAQARLAHATRVTALGELTASIAHEVNQPLSAILNNANACLGLLSTGAPAELEEARAALADITLDAERASAVIERVRALARRAPPTRERLQLADVVGDVVILAARELATRRVTIRRNAVAPLPIVLGDRVQLQQVLLNLVVNGMDAMADLDEEKRLLEISESPETLDGKPAATIRVRDRGVGLGEADTDRLFEAFYTTKPNGMGMGLAISRSIIEAHGGRMWAAPNAGPGASFGFTLLAADSGQP